MTEDRRQFQRVGVEASLPVLLDGAADGVVLDLCEGGFGVSELTARTAGEVIPFAFNLPEGTGRIRGKARIAWKSESGHRSGLHFVELSDPSRQHLHQWLSTRAWTMRLDGMEKEYPERADTAHVATQIPADSLPVNVAAKANEGWALPPMPPTLGAEFDSNEPNLIAGASAPSAGSTRTIGIALAIVLLASGLGFLVSSSRGMRAKAQARNSSPLQLPAATAQEPMPPADLASATTTPRAAAPPTTLSPAPAAHLADSGFVLQVGAMTHEAYASALAKDLQEKNLPAFVFRREGDNFYRVAVGPLHDADSSTKVREALEKQGLKPFLRPWSADAR